MDKNKQIEKYLVEPLKEGDKVYIRGLGLQNKQNWGSLVEVILVNEDKSIEYKYGKRTGIATKDNYKKYINDIGYNPIIQKPWNSKLRIVAFNFSSILSSCGFDRYKMKTVSEFLQDGNKNSVEIKELNWNPTVIDKTGKEVGYQRDFVWTLEQKQLLIDSIYNRIDIGKIIVRKRSFNWIQDKINKGEEASFKDIVDGKQRLNAIISFLRDEYKDNKGYLFSQFSKTSQRQFLDFNGISYGELGEDATDEDTISTFLGVNFTGVPMSKEHIEFVKKIQF